jgi:DNA-binding beta-propeller fold protein YncE
MMEESMQHEIEGEGRSMGGDAILVLVEKGDGRLAFMNLRTSTFETRIDLGKYPHELLVDLDRGYALVGHYGQQSSAEAGPGGSSVFVVDLATRAVVNTLDCAPHGRIHGIAQDKSGCVYALSESDALLLRFERALGTTKPSAVIPVGGDKSHLITVTADGCHAFSMNLASNSVTKLKLAEPESSPAPLTPGDRPEGNCLSSDESILFVTNRGSDTVAAVNVAGWTVERVAKVRRDPLRVYLAGRDRLLVIFLEGRALALLEQETLQELAHLNLQARPTAACVVGNGGRAFVSLDSNVVLEVDLQTFEPIATRATGSEPDACFVLPPNGQLAGGANAG